MLLSKGKHSYLSQAVKNSLPHRFQIINKKSGAPCSLPDFFVESGMALMPQSMTTAPGLIQLPWGKNRKWNSEGFRWQILPQHLSYSYKDKCSKGGTIGAQGKCCCSSQTDKVVRRGCLNIKCWTKIAKTFLVNGWLSWRNDNRSYLDHLWFADSHHEDVRHPAHLLEVARPEIQGFLLSLLYWLVYLMFGQIQKGILDILE